MKIIGIEGLTVDELNQELELGAKFVIFEYCISVLIVTFKRPTDIYFIKAHEGAMSKSLGFTMMSLFLGWWGFPWGPIYTVSSVATNLGGGRDVTDEVVQSMSEGYVPNQ